MHYLMLVTLTLPEIATSEQARWAVYDALSNDTTFCGDGGRFGVPVCDWFVIGGRWSGLLAETQIGKPFRDAVINRFPLMAENWWPHSLAEEHREALDAIWQANGGTGASPYTRRDASEYGHDDDAMPLTTELYDKLLSVHHGEAIVCSEGHCQYLDLDDEPLTPDAIGSKWIVVVDYHN